MSKKFFSLIHGEGVHIAPETKILKREAFEKLVDSEGVLKAVREDAKQFKKEVAEECEKERVQAQKEGFEKGYREFVDAIVALEKEMGKVRSDMEEVIVPIALKAAKKIVGKELEAREGTVVDIVASALKPVSQHKKINIYVNKNDLEILEKHRKRLKEMFERLESLSIQAKEDVTPGGCIIETEGGIINAQLDNQWLILESAFEKLVSSRKGKEKPPESTVASGIEDEQQ